MFCVSDITNTLFLDPDSPVYAIITSFFFQGTYLVMGLYMLLLFIQNRKQDYLLYAIYLLIFTLYFFIRIDTVLRLHMFTTGQESYYHLLIPILLVITGIYVRFINVFADIKRFDPGFSKRLNIFTVLLGIIAGSILIYTLITNDFSSIERYGFFVLIPMHLYTLFALIKAFFVIKTKLRHYVLWANIFLFTFSIIGVYSSQGSNYSEGIYSNFLFGFYPFNSSQLGTFLEMVCFSLGLGYKFSLVEKEKNEVKQKYIEQLKENESVTKRLNEELTDMVAVRTKELANKTKLLEKEQAIKSRFFENISHEFRTPLTLIKSPIDESLRTDKKLSKKLLQLISNNAHRLTQLINDLLSLSKIEAGKITLNKSNQNPFAQSNHIASQFHSLAEEKGIVYEVIIGKEPVYALYDKSILDKVLFNLISNAIKYTPSGGKIQVKTCLKNGYFEVQVDDKGIGISKPDQEHIFDRFYQSENRTTSVTGTGIGLALVKELIELHGGNVHVSSELHKGSSFCARIPLEKIQRRAEQDFDTREDKFGATQKTEAKWPQKQVNDKPMVLLVEDNEDLQNYLKEQLEQTYTIRIASNGAEGIAKGIKHMPDIIVSDIMMPKKNGYELCKTLKEDPRTSHIPIVLLTAKSSDESAISGYETGADAYITKPFNIRMLLVRLEKLITIRQKIRDHFAKHELILPKDVSIPPVEERILKRMQYVLNEKLNDPAFNATLFAKEMGMSRMQLHRKLQALTGHATTAFIRSQRLKQAEHLLKSSDASINEIAYSVGFNTPSYFIKCFKETYNMTPAMYMETA